MNLDKNSPLFGQITIDTLETSRNFQQMVDIKYLEFHRQNSRNGQSNYKNRFKHMVARRVLMIICDQHSHDGNYPEVKKFIINTYYLSIITSKKNAWRKSARFCI